MTRYRLPLFALIALVAVGCGQASQKPARAAGAAGEPIVAPPAAPRLRALAAGEQHFCALRGDGRVLCWGNNEDFQAGDVDDQAIGTPWLVEGIAGATRIAAGGRATCAVLGDGSLTCWGNGLWRAPRVVPLPGKARDVALGGDTIVVEVEAGPGNSTLFGGTLGRVEKLVPFRDGNRPRAIKSIFVCGQTLPAPGAPVCRSSIETIPAPAGATAIDDDGCFIGPKGRACPVEDKLHLDGFSDAPPAWRRHFETRPPLFAVAHFFGSDVGCGGYPDGRIECHGIGDRGQFGDGRFGEPSPPAPVAGLADVAQVRLSADVDKNHPIACARTRGGAVSCWVVGETAPIALPIQDALDITVNLVRVVALRRDGTVVEIPLDLHEGSRLVAGAAAPLKGPLAKRRYASLVDSGVPGAITPEGQLVQTRCPGSGNACVSTYDVKSIRARAAGWDMDRTYACVLDDKGAIQCRVNDTEVGILGDGRVVAKGAYDAAKRFVMAEGRAALPGPAAQVAAAVAHVCARLQTGELRCWGEDLYGALGNGGPRLPKGAAANEPGRVSATPVAPVGIGKVLDVAASTSATCALDEENAVWCWGQTSVIPASSSGQTPVRLDLPKATSVAMSHAAVCIITQKGEVVCQRDRAPGRPKDRKSSFRLPE
ncbi:RCC1 domain-containing protein [Polyangium jinanense]|uniref:RCC1 domain-containing protein n=1 Tax=Polyangium jinanense TaxID=2829994 RepID=UPI0023423570|nr:hypothetical protein [Polyangium jinanense]